MLQFAHGRVQWLTTQALNTTIAVTGLGFQPKAIRFYWVGLQSTATAANGTVDERRGIGFATSTTSRACVGTTSLNASGNSDCGSIWSNTQCVITVSAAGVKDGALDISSIDANGFTLIVDDVTPANLTVSWEAWGGDEITNVTIGAIAEPAATGTQNYTATGFVTTPTVHEDQCVMLAGVQSVNATDVGQAQDSGMHVGFATSTLTNNNITLCGNSDDASGTMDTDGYNYTGDCLSMIVIAGGTLVNARATLSAYGAGIFTLNWLARATTNRRSIYMAIKGGQWSAGDTRIEGQTLNSTALIPVQPQILSIPFNLKGVSLMGAQKQISVVATATTEDRMGFGSGTSTTVRNSSAIWDVDALGTSEIYASLYTTQVLVYPSNVGTLQTAYDINRIGANQIQLITDTAGGVTNEWIGYLVFGDKKVTAGTIGHPFIF